MVNKKKKYQNGGHLTEVLVNLQLRYVEMK